MAQEFAKAFYNSKLWQQCREQILKRDRYLCQTRGCHNIAEEVHHIRKLTPSNINDPSVSLNPDNLTSLCGDCHKARHVQDKLEGRKKRNAHKVLPDVIFDEEGYPIEIADKPPQGDT